jgi:hypothetical protein
MKRILSTLSLKWPEYLIESIVIVASILGAYALDNWNEGQNENKLEQNYLTTLRNDIATQLKLIDRQILFENNCKSATSFILNKGVNALVKENPDTLVYLLSCLRVRTTFSTADATFEDLKSTGNIRLISNINLRHELVSYYQDLDRIERVVLSNNEKSVDDSFNNGLLLTGLVNIVPEAQNPKTTFNKMIRVTSIEERYHTHSLKKLETIDNQMMLTNLVKVRASVPNSHLILMSELKSKTQILLENLTNELKK